MGISTASLHNTFFEPQPLGTAQLQDCLTFFSVEAERLAKTYKTLGEAYHDIPLCLRNDHEYCHIAFTCCDLREMPDMVQIINMLGERFARVRAAIVCEELSIAVGQLRIASNLLEEAKDRVSKLTYAMSRYKWLTESLKSGPDGEQWNMLWLQPTDNTAVQLTNLQTQSRLSWLDALPKHLLVDDLEDKMSGVGS